MTWPALFATAKPLAADILAAEEAALQQITVAPQPLSSVWQPVQSPVCAEGARAGEADDEDEEEEEEEEKRQQSVATAALVGLELSAENRELKALLEEKRKLAAVELTMPGYEECFQGF